MARKSEKKINALIKEWKDSGLSMKRWCQRSGIAPSIFLECKSKKNETPHLNPQDFLLLDEGCLELMELSC